MVVEVEKVGPKGWGAPIVGACEALKGGAQKGGAQGRTG